MNRFSFILLVFVLSSNIALGQVNVTADSNGNLNISRVKINGNVQGVNLSNSAIQTEQHFVDLGGANLLGSGILFKTNNGTASWVLGGVGGTVGNPGDISGYPGGLAFYTKPKDQSYSSLPLERMRIDQYGNVGIGTSKPQEALSVNGNIRSRQVKVETSNWPDYVFDLDYKLPSLQSLESYIDEHHRLPEIPSQKEIDEDGQNLGEINKLLLKKVEELTLYLIDDHKKIVELQKQLKATQTRQGGRFYFKKTKDKRYIIRKNQVLRSYNLD